MSFAWVQRDWSNSPDVDNMPQAAQYNVNCETCFQGNRKCACVWQCRVQRALLSYAPSGIHLLKLLGPLCAIPASVGWNTTVVEKRIWAACWCLLRKPFQGAVLLHLSGREDYGLDLKEQRYTFISRICQGAICERSTTSKGRRDSPKGKGNCMTDLASTVDQENW